MLQDHKAQEYSYKAEMKQLLHLIIHSLYNHPEVFLRELVSNSSDALNKVRFRKLTDNNFIDSDVELNIKITLDKESGEFTLEDSGIGMTKEDLIERIGTIASSGTLEFISSIKPGEKLDGNMIGKFGVGFYSVFMVTDEVTIDTRFYDNDSTAVRWSSKGEDSFTIEESDQTARGTKIKFKFKEEYKYLADTYQIKNILTKYSNFVDFPIYLNDEKVNIVTPLWQKKDKDIESDELNEFYKFISNDYQEPMGHLKLDIEGRINFKALIYVPSVAPPTLFTDRDGKTLHLYSSNIFIQDNCQELLPEYLRFLKGVVDSEDLPLNVSREVTQSSPLISKMKDVITNKTLSLLEEWADKDIEKYNKFFEQFGSLFKTGVNSDYTNKKRIMELLRYESTKTVGSETVSLNKYFSNMPSDQDAIYYITGASKEQIVRNPNLEYFKKNNIEVLFLTDPVDVFTVPYFGEYENKQFKSIDKADLNIESKSEESNEVIPNEMKGSFIELAKTILGDKVEDIIESKRLIDSPCTLVIGSMGLDPQMEKMMQMLNKDYSLSKRIFEINLSHPLIKNLVNIFENDKEDVRIKQAIEQMYEGALLMEGYLKNPADFLSRMTEFMVSATGK